MKHTLYIAEYNCGTYGSGAYQAACGSESGLANTGYDVLLPVFLGISLIVAGALLLTKRWLRKRTQRQIEA